jgi:hypothetical protein
MIHPSFKQFHAKGLQKSLDILKTYCDKWNLKVNIGKTKVIVFNKSGRILKGFFLLICLTPIFVSNVLVIPSGKSTENDTFLYILSRTLKKLPLILY